jgi:hypothetical protein
MKTLIAALALVTLMAGPTFAKPAARAYVPGTFIFKPDRELCQSGKSEFCHWQGYPLWQWYSGA